ncbi:MAG: hypothetical protein NVSMB5_11300 [Candidatus Velthaea sp.]
MCHQTVRLVAEAFEHAGLATVVVGTMRAPLAGLPRVLITKYHRGMNFGAAGDAAEHEAIAREALALFDAHERVLTEHVPAAAAPVTG